MERITTYFTDVGVPATGLTVTINIWTNDGVQRVTNGTCSEIAGGFYVYNFDGYDADKIYLYQFDGSNALGDTDRYKFGSNELDNYTNKYSFGRAGIVVPNYDGHFKGMADRFDNFKMPEPYNDKQLRTLVKNVADLIKQQNNSDVLEMIDEVKEGLAKMEQLVSSIDAREGVNGVGMTIQEVKEELREEIKSIAQELSASIDSKHMEMNDKMSTEYTADNMMSKTNDKLQALINKAEDLFVAAMQKEMPDKILSKFEVKLSKKDDTDSLKELESMAD